MKLEVVVVVASLAISACGASGQIGYQDGGAGGATAGGTTGGGEGGGSAGGATAGGGAAGGTAGGVAGGTAGGAAGGTAGGAAGGTAGGGCVALDDATLCAQAQLDCGTPSLTDNCGAARAVSCGSCTLPRRCGGTGLPSVCGEPAGATVWGRFSNPGFWRIEFLAPALAVNSSGVVTVAAHMRRDVDLGTGPLVLRGSGNSFIARYSASDLPLWTANYGNPGGLGYDNVIAGVAHDADGNLYVVGHVENGVALPGQVLTPMCSACNPAHDCFTAKFLPNGALAWAKLFGHNGWGALPAGIAVSASGQVVAACHLNSTAGTRIMSVNPDGGTAWAKPLPGGTGVELSGLTLAANGDVVVAGAYQGSPTLGAGPLPAAAARDAFVARFDAILESPRVLSTFGSIGDDWVRAIAFAPDGTLVIAGDGVGTLDLGFGPAAGMGQRDVVLQHLRADGGVAFASRHGGGGVEFAHGLAVDRGGNVVVAASFEGTASFGGTPLTSAGSRDAVLFKVADNGAPLWARRWGGSGVDRALAVATGPDGFVSVVGDLQATVDFADAGTYASNAAGDHSAMFLLRLAP